MRSWVRHQISRPEGVDRYSLEKMIDQINFALKDLYKGVSDDHEGEVEDKLESRKMETVYENTTGQTLFLQVSVRGS